MKRAGSREELSPGAVCSRVPAMLPGDQVAARSAGLYYKVLPGSPADGPGRGSTTVLGGGGTSVNHVLVAYPAAQ